MDQTLQMTLISIAACVVILIITLIVVWILRRRKSGTSLGRKGERKVSRALRKFARFKEAKVFDNVYLPLYDGLTQIDHILVAPFGVMVVETKNWRGSIYGSSNEEQWLQVLGEARNYHYNPLMQNKTHTDNLQHLFRKQNVYHTSVEGAVVFAGGRADLYCPRNVPVYTLKQFKKRLKQPAYQSESKINVERVCEVIEKGRITDKAKIAAHDETVRNAAH